MDYSSDESRRTRKATGRRLFAIALGLSLALHGAALWEWRPSMRPLALDVGRAHDGNAPLTVAVVPQQRAAAAPAPPPAPPPAPAPKSAPTAPRPRPPVMTARAAPAPRIAMPDMPAPLVVPPAPAPPPVAPPLEMPQRSLAAPEPARAEPRPEDFADLASFMAAKRRARGQSASGPSTPEDDDIARRDAIVAANLAGINAPDFGAERRNSGGLFQITRLGYDEAEFTFFGWNRDIRRRASQRIEVQRGDAADIRIAIVRRMIAIIREYEQGDFTWRSNRLGRDVTLSARLDDNAGLEEFMLREFFANPRGPG